MPLFHDSKAYFACVPKTGCTTILILFQPNKFSEPFTNCLWDGKRTLLEDLFGIYKNLRLHHIPVPLAKTLMPDEIFSTYFKFACVRNPYHRLVSAWAWRKKIGEKHSFEFFVKEIVPQEYLQTEGVTCHLYPQYEFLHEDGKCLVDKIIYFEELEKGIKEIAAILGVAVPDKIGKHNVAEHDVPESYYTPELYEIVNSLYSKDFEAFGYEITSQVPK